MSAEAAISCARALVDALLAAGCAGFVVAPGSRSTPLVLAIAASGAPSWIVLDERSAGFFALGRAAVTRAPVAVVTTSGTATANLLPAIVEASQSRIPLLAITADRPPELHGVGANQAIEQHGLYAAFVRAELDLDTATARGEADWSAAGQRAARIATTAPFGPVHVNAPFREPFTPAASPAPSPSRAAEGVAVVTHEQHEPSSDPDFAWLRDQLAAARRPLLYVGGLDDPQDACISGVRTLPMLAEVTANVARAPGTAALFAPAVTDALAPDLLIRLGRAPLTRAAQTFAASAERTVTIDPDGWIHDPDRRAARTITATGSQLSGAVFPAASPQQEWLERWQRVHEAAEEAIAEVDADVELWEGAVGRILAAENARLLAGNSTPIRDLERYAARPVRAGVRANRGASGIDGLVSTFAGMSTQGVPTIALLGDLSVLHDASGLVWLGREHPGTLVIVDNDGGGIFDHLPSAALHEHERWFVTPHAGRLEGLLAGCGLPVTTVTTREELHEVLAAASLEAPMRIVRVPVARARALEIRRQVQAATDAAIARALID